MDPELVVYKTIGDVALNLHIFEPESPKAKHAAIVFFFGGGWVGGTPSQFYPQSRELAERGMTAICAEYRIRGKHGTSPYECVADGKSAVRWIRQHADELGIDAGRIVAGGGSAGGHVAACTALLPGYDDEDSSVSSAPNALTLFNPVIDTSPEGFGSDRFGDNWQSISPLHHMRPDLPPTLIQHGTADTTVPFAGVERFESAMKAAGNFCRLIPYEGKEHGFFNPGRGDDSYDKTTAALIAFLTEQGFIEA